MYFGSVEEMLERSVYYLEHPEERRSIARRAHEITEKGHRYIHRVQRIVSTFGL